MAEVSPSNEAYEVFASAVGFPVPDSTGIASECANSKALSILKGNLNKPPLTNQSFDSAFSHLNHPTACHLPHANTYRA